MKARVYYKVVWRSPGGFLESCVAPDELCVRYTPGIEVRSDHGPLFAFDLLENAQAFQKRYASDGYEVWECAAGKATPLNSVIVLVGGPGMLTEALRFWEHGGRLSIGVRDAPVGTVACDWVKLTRQVDV